MGGAANNKQKKSAFSLASLFKPRRHRARIEDAPVEEMMTGGRRDEEKRYWPVPEPGIDGKATAFIANFHAARMLEALNNYQAVEN